jgi:hypothetical protein
LSAVVLISKHITGKSGRSNHIDLQFNFVSKRFHRGEVSVSFVPTGEQHANVFTKQLSGPVLKKHRGAVMGAANQRHSK